MATFSGDVQYSQVMGHLTTPVIGKSSNEMSDFPPSNQQLWPTNQAQAAESSVKKAGTWGHGEDVASKHEKMMGVCVCDTLW